MTFRLTMAAAAIALIAAPQAANAGNTTMTNAKGQKVSIQCRNSGCAIQVFDKNGAIKSNRTGPGGTANFKKQVAKYRKKGYR